MKTVFPISLIVFLLAACAQVPISGRKQMNLNSEQDLIAMSKTEYDKFLASSDVVQYGSQKEMIQNVGQKLAAATEQFLATQHASKRLEGFEWEFNLVNSDQLNAWCMPGGKICFYTGILDVCQDETGIAVVMGHEIAHAIARHGNERMSKGAMVNLGGQALGVAISQKSEAAQTLLLKTYGVASQVGMLKYSRNHELEADMMGLVFMQLAGYDAQKAVDFWKRMAANGSGGLEILSTHPSDETRVAEIEKFLASEDFKKYTSK